MNQTSQYRPGDAVDVDSDLDLYLKNPRAGGFKDSFVLIDQISYMEAPRTRDYAKDHTSFARFIGHVKPGMKRWRASKLDLFDCAVLYVYLSGSRATELVRQVYPTPAEWDSFDDVDRHFRLPEGTIRSLV
jgi:hypothetical protein